jgi:hypothetical protein
MRCTLFSIMFFCCVQAHAQIDTVHGSFFDTIKLAEFKAKKIVAYKISYITVYVSYNFYYSDLGLFLKRRDEMMKQYGIKENDKGYKLVNAVYKRIQKQIKTSDTIYLDQKDFDKKGLTCLLSIDYAIEHGECAIVDNRNQKQSIIIRQKLSWDGIPLSGWGGRRYFLPGKSDYFFEVTDWIS